MKTNRKNRNKGWQVFLLFVILVFQMFFVENVFALEENSLDIEAMETIVEDVQEKGKELVDSVSPKDEVSSFEEVVEAVTKEEIWNCYSEKMKFSFDTVVIQDKINEALKVEDVLKNISIESLKKDYSVLEVYIIDELGSILNLEDEITGMEKLVFLGTDYLLFYEIRLLGDYTQDGIVDLEDVEEAVNVHSQNPEEIKTEEVSYVDSVVKNNTYEVPSVEEDVFVESKLEMIDQEIYIDEMVMISYTLEGIESLGANVIRGEVEFDDNSLEFVDVYFSGNSMIKGKINGNSFIYLLDDVEEISPLLIGVFRPKVGGMEKVSIQNIQIACNGILLNSNSEVSVEFLIQTYGIGGDVEMNHPSIEDEVIDSNIHLDYSVSNSNQSEVQMLEKNPVIQATEIYLNSDNYIEKLGIQGYYISFDKYQEEYKIVVENDVDKLLFDVVLSHNNATYFVNGNQNFKVGKNKVVLTVQAEDGGTRDYVIEVDKKEKKVANAKEDKEEKIRNWVSKIILLVLMLAIVWCLYLFIKKEEK